MVLKRLSVPALGQAPTQGGSGGGGGGGVRKSLASALATATAMSLPDDDGG